MATKTAVHGNALQHVKRSSHVVHVTYAKYTVCIFNSGNLTGHKTFMPYHDISAYSVFSEAIGIYLTNRLHFAVRLFSSRSQMTLKFGKNKKVAHDKWVTDVLTPIDNSRVTITQ